MPHARRLVGAAALALAVTVGLVQVVNSAGPADAGTAAPPIQTLGRTTLGGADPSVIKVGGRYVSAKSADGGIVVRSAATLDGVATAPKKKVWSDAGNLGEVWAPEIVHHDGRYRIYFSAGRSSAHRMYQISSTQPDSGYSAHAKVQLPADQWAIDGAPFTFQGQRWFVWSGWSGAAGANEQNLYIARMTSATATTGGRYVISQPREPWERTVGNPFINEAPQPIVDPNGQLHVVYSANGSWSSRYCLADLRLRRRQPHRRVGLVQEQRLPVRLRPGEHDVRLESHRAGRRAGPEHVRAGPRQRRREPAVRQPVPDHVPRRRQGHAVLVVGPLLVHRHRGLVGQHHLPPRQRPRPDRRQRVQPQVLRVSNPYRE